MFADQLAGLPNAEDLEREIDTRRETEPSLKAIGAAGAVHAKSSGWKYERPVPAFERARTS